MPVSFAPNKRLPSIIDRLTPVRLAGLSCWRALSESTSLLTFLGYHAESSSPTYQPCLSSETRRRVAAHVFIMDKVVVLFTGRPPQISHRYVSTPLPLDLDDEELFAGEAAIADSVRSLDDNGWNTKGGLYAATTLRCRLLIAFIRDELIEIAVGNWKETPIDTLLYVLIPPDVKSSRKSKRFLLTCEQALEETRERHHDELSGLGSLP